MQRGEAAVLLAKAERFIDTAKIVLDEFRRADAEPLRGAVGAWRHRRLRRHLLQATGTAAAWSRPPASHRTVRKIASNGPELARALARVLDFKDGSQYGKAFLDRDRTLGAPRQARVLLEAARIA